MQRRVPTERRLLLLIGAVQFVNVLDFMMVMPLVESRVRRRERGDAARPEAWPLPEVARPPSTEARADAALP